MNWTKHEQKEKQNSLYLTGSQYSFGFFEFVKGFKNKISDLASTSSFRTSKVCLPTPCLLDMYHAKSLFGKLITITEWCWKSSFAFHSKVSQKLDYGVNYNYKLTISCDPQTRIANCNWYFEFVAQALSVNRGCHDLTMHKRKIKSPLQVPGLLLTTIHKQR